MAAGDVAGDLPSGKKPPNVSPSRWHRAGSRVRGSPAVFRGDDSLCLSFPAGAGATWPPPSPARHAAPAAAPRPLRRWWRVISGWRVARLRNQITFDVARAIFIPPRSRWSCTRRHPRHLTVLRVLCHSLPARSLPGSPEDAPRPRHPPALAASLPGCAQLLLPPYCSQKLGTDPHPSG